MKSMALKGRTFKLMSAVELPQQKYISWVLSLFSKLIRIYPSTLLVVPLSLLVILLAKITQSDLIFFSAHALIVFTQSKFIVTPRNGSKKRTAKSFILKRHYLIKNSTERVLVEHSPTLKGKVVVLEKYTQQEITEIVETALPLLAEIAEKDPIMKEFWSLATDQLKHDLAISYYSHQHRRSKKVLNVETVNWESISSFQVKYNDLLGQRFSLFHPTQAVKALIRTIGKHNSNLRFHNIHLATDFINKQFVHQIHWDIETPTNPKRSLKHFWIDDFLG